MVSSLLFCIKTLCYIMSRNSNVTDYAEDVLAWMHSKELEHARYNGNSPQLKMRGSLIEFLQFVCERLKLSSATTHLSAYLLDRFMDAHYISTNQLKLTALTAILLAAKFEEKDTNVPRIPELNAFVKSKYGIAIFNSMEAFMLNFYNWNVGTVTTAHFAEFFLMQGVTTNDTIEGASVTVPSLVQERVSKSTSQFLNISLQDKTFLQWKSSLVAAACVACGRYDCSITPIWPESLQETTGYQLRALSQIIDLLLRLREGDDKECECQTPDSAYGSRSSSTERSPAF